MTIDNRDKLKTFAMCIAGLIALWCAFIIGWCTMWKIYIEVPVLFVLSNTITGIASCITTVLVGRTMAQLNQPADSETTMTQKVETVTQIKPIIAPPVQPTSEPAPVSTQPES